MRLLALAEGLFLTTLVAAPWLYGGATDAARFTVVAVLLTGGSLAVLGGLPLPRLAVPLAGLALLPLVQVVAGRAVSPPHTLEGALVLSGTGAVALFWVDRGRDARAAIRLAAAVLGVCLAQGVFGILERSWAPGLVYGEPVPSGTPFGSFVSHNHFAGLLGLGVLLALGTAYGRARREGGVGVGAVVLGGLTLALGAAHLASLSRGGLVALLGGLVLFGALSATGAGRARRSPRKRQLMAVGFASAAVIAFGLAAVPESTRQRLASVLDARSDPSGRYRIDTAVDTLRMTAARPLFGWGLGAYEDAFAPFKRAHGEVRTTRAESDVLEFASEAGLVGYAIAAWIGVVVWQGYSDRMRHERDPVRRGIAVGAMAACGTLLIHSLVDFNLRIPSNALVFASLLGLAASPCSEPRRIGGARLSAAVAVVLALLSLASAWRAFGAWELERALAVEEARARVAALDPVLTRHPYLDEGLRARGLAWRDLALAGGAVQARRLEAAGRDLLAALELRPRLGEAWADLGWVRFLEGEPTAAEAAFRRAIELDPTHIGIGVAYGEFLAVTGRVTGAIEELARLRRMNPRWSAGSARKVASRWTQDAELLARIR